MNTGATSQHPSTHVQGAAPPTVTKPFRVPKEHVVATERVFSHLPTLYNARGDFSPSGAPSTMIFPQRSGTQNATTRLGKT
jgi:hypothetical protein